MPARSRLGERLPILILGLMFLPTGVQAAFAPRSFWDDFPLGRSWVAAGGGAYDEHLVRDVGALFLALCIASIWAWWRPSLCRPLAVAWSVEGTLHLVYHLGHVGEVRGIDRVGLVASLVAVPILAVWSLVVGSLDSVRRPRTSARSGASDDR
jgi:hypothetical protein